MTAEELGRLCVNTIRFLAVDMPCDLTVDHVAARALALVGGHA